MKTPEIYKVEILKIIQKDKTLSELQNLDYDTETIAEIINILVSEELVSQKDKSIKLSQKGLNLIEKFEFPEKAKWIREEKESKIDQIEVDFVYLPNKDEFTFLL